MTRHSLLALLLCGFPLFAHAQGAAASEHGGQICWAWVATPQPIPEAAARIAEERCQRGDVLAVSGVGMDPVPLAASFCDLAHPVTFNRHADGAETVQSLLCLYSGQRRLGRNGQDRPRRR